MFKIEAEIKNDSFFIFIGTHLFVAFLHLQIVSYICYTTFENNDFFMISTSFVDMAQEN